MQKNILEYIEKTVHQYPDKTAFVSLEKSFTFTDVSTLSRSIGTQLIEKGVKSSPIVVFMGRKIEVIPTYLGIVYSGNYYVPINPEMPQDRINHIIENLKPKYIICDDDTYAKGEELIDHHRVLLFNNLINSKINTKKLDAVRRKVLDTDPVYIVYTSGSTGQPKGVIASHRSVIDYIDHLVDILEVSDATVFGNQTPLYLDACLKEVFSTLKCGSTAYIIPKKLFMFPIKLIEYLNENRINTVCWVVSAFTIISSLNALVNHSPKYLKTIAFGSEVFPIKQFNRWVEALPEARFLNLYGPTEGTGMCCFYEVNRSFDKNDRIPIGKAFDNTEIFLLDDDNKPVTEDGIGEICIRGASLTLGYYNDFEKTKEKFVQNPLNNLYPELIYRTGDLGQYNSYGELEFISRKDHQIKHMGHRIELGEIESVANNLTGIKSVCCTYNMKKKRIIIHYTGMLDQKSIINQLKNKLPQHMLPTKFKKLEEMPLTLNGKIDRVKLKNSH
ncbi:MAG TPA: amino acid adenylation domain-containing protein [Clostridia bacterium]|nr:amino acid adenylation domain-containing protein [Clostridia bacterium]